MEIYAEFFTPKFNIDRERISRISARKLTSPRPTEGLLVGFAANLTGPLANLSEGWENTGGSAGPR